MPMPMPMMPKTMTMLRGDGRPRATGSLPRGSLHYSTTTDQYVLHLNHHSSVVTSTWLAGFCSAPRTLLHLRCRPPVGTRFLPTACVSHLVRASFQPNAIPSTSNATSGRTSGCDGSEHATAEKVMRATWSQLRLCRICRRHDTICFSDSTGALSGSCSMLATAVNNTDVASSDMDGSTVARWCRRRV
jgi:hypothetical protein